MTRSVVIFARDPALRNAFARELRKNSTQVTARHHAEGWTRLLEDSRVRGIVICDDLEDADLELLCHKAQKLRPDVAIAQIRVSEESVSAQLGEAIHAAADVDELAAWYADELEAQRDDEREMSFEAEILGEGGVVEQVIRGRNGEISRILGIIDTIGPTDSTVLFQGESGTGKDLFARLIHQRSPRREAPFVAVNCGAIPDTLIESELFGYEKGAFTGADAPKVGLCVAADGGTLFLDEIGEMSQDMQIKLLRVLQSGWLRPMGSTKSEKVDVRVIAATNRDLKQEVKSGAFRLDLYYRLNVINIRMPALRERIEDLPLLVSGIVRRLSPNDPPPEFSQDVLDVLCQYSWPGNIRELENIVERMLLLHPDGNVPASEVRQQLRDMELTPEDSLPALAPVAAEVGQELPYPLDWTLKEVEEAHIRQVLAKYQGNQTRAARSLGINVKTLYNRMRASGMRREEFLEHEAQP